MSDPAVLDLGLELSLPGFAARVRLRSRSRRTALFGRSGSGKTLLLEVLAGLRRPDSGYVRVLGETFFDRAARVDVTPAARRVGYVPQAYDLFPHMSAAANVGYGVRGPKRERVRELLRLVDLENAAHRRPHELSGGERQRVAVARALGAEPRLLLLDEPFSALDDHVRRGLRASLAELLTELATPVVLVTHDMEEATRLADEIVVLERGAAIQVGTADDVLRRPATAGVADLVGMTNRLTGPVLEATDRSVLVRWGTSPMAAAARTGVRAGATVTLGLRPEALRVLGPAGNGAAEGRAGPPPNQQAFEATVERLEREGLYWLLLARGPDGTRLVSKYLGPHGAGLDADWTPTPGERVLLAADTDALWPLVEEGHLGEG
ncbi:MAG: ABC transporter ATP-binding protein [Trueperaceae bacterium]|nr:ABC transporter ATP-binding protein [Trueperaceae bacterium]